jgi:hypothetical protein
MKTCFEVDGTFTDLEFPSPNVPLPFVFVVMILHDHPPLVVLPTDGLANDVALIVPCV